MDECTEQEVQRMLPMVSAQRREQALRYRHTFGQFCCLKSWMILRAMIIGEMDFLYNEQGKPYIERGPYFSISHCKAGIAVALDDEPVGIDIETIRRADDELIQRTMNAEEQALIKSAGEEREAREFTRLWTKKEAVVKCLGTGIQSFEQLQNILAKYRNIDISTFEKENYIYSIAYGKLHCFGAKVPSSDL